MKSKQDLSAAFRSHSCAYFHLGRSLQVSGFWFADWPGWKHLPCPWQLLLVLADTATLKGQ